MTVLYIICGQWLLIFCLSKLISYFYPPLSPNCSLLSKNSLNSITPILCFNISLICITFHSSTCLVPVHSSKPTSTPTISMKSSLIIVAPSDCLISPQEQWSYIYRPLPGVFQVEIHVFLTMGALQKLTEWKEERFNGSGAIGVRMNEILSTTWTRPWDL